MRLRHDDDSSNDENNNNNNNNNNSSSSSTYKVGLVEVPKDAQRCFVQKV